MKMMPYKLVFIFLGIVTLALGTLGIVLPILPTVPLYLLTLVLFAHSSERMRVWYIKTKVYKKYLLPYLEAGGLTKRAKVTLILFVTLQIAIAAIIVRHSIIGLVICGALYVGFLLSMFFAVKTITLPINTEEKKNGRK